MKLKKGNKTVEIKKRGARKPDKPSEPKKYRKVKWKNLA